MAEQWTAWFAAKDNEQNKEIDAIIQPLPERFHENQYPG
jgi:hypothetical protein